RNALDVDDGAGFAGAGGNCIRHRLDVTVSGVVEHEYLGHDGLLRVCRWVSSWGKSCAIVARKRVSRFQPAHDGWVAYGASTSTSSLSSSAVIFSFASSVIAAPSRALTRPPLISTASSAGQR